MKKLLFFLLLLAGFVSCKKDNEANPKTDADAVAGTYKLTAFLLESTDVNESVDQIPGKLSDGRTLSAGSIVLTKKDEKTVTGTLSLTINGSSKQSSFGDLTVQKSADYYSLSQDGVEVSRTDLKEIVMAFASQNEKLVLAGQR